MILIQQKNKSTTTIPITVTIPFLFLLVTLLFPTVTSFCTVKKTDLPTGASAVSEECEAFDSLCGVACDVATYSGTIVFSCLEDIASTVDTCIKSCIVPSA